MKPAIRVGLVVLLSSLAGQAQAAPPQFVLQRAGLYGTGYTNAQGQHQNSALFLNQNGLLVGSANRFDPSTGAARGVARWAWQNGVTQRIGFFDAAHTASNGTQETFVVRPNAAGVIVGTSSRYSGNTPTFNTAWQLENGAYTTLGLTDTLHTGSGETRSAFVRNVTTSGDSAGSSVQFLASGGASTRTTAWARRGGVTVALGLSDAQHTQPDASRSSFSVAIAENGAVAGQSSRYTPAGASSGSSSWINDGTTTRRIGLTDALHTGPQGEQNSNVRAINPQGLVIGESQSWVPFPQIGNSTWIATPQGVTTRIGLIDSEHTNALAGTQYSETLAINGQGRVTGRSFRYNAQGNNGESAWIYASGVTTRIGLTGPGFQDPQSGFAFSSARQLAGNGHVLGESTIFTPQANGGPAAWVYDGVTTTRAGLTDALHTNPSSGLQSSQPIAINNVGDAVGTSTRYAEPFLSQSGWFFDSLTKVSQPLVFSVSANNEAITNPQIVLDNRTVLGSYRHYPTNSQRLFWWSQSDGSFDITDFVPGGVAGANWDFLSSIFGSVVPGSFDGTTIVGTGRATGILGSSVFVLTPIPTPGALGLMGLAGVLAMRRRR